MMLWPPPKVYLIAESNTIPIFNIWNIVRASTLQIVPDFSYLKVTANRAGKQGIYDIVMYPLPFGL